jgi:hypothetical protein
MMVRVDWMRELTISAGCFAFRPLKYKAVRALHRFGSAGIKTDS